MTLDEAIKMANIESKNNIGIPTKETWKQLAEWLEDYKHLKEDRNSFFNFYEVVKIQCEKEYNKAIDDFVQLVKNHEWNIRNRNEDKFIYGAIDKLAEQLKEGEQDDRTRRSH